MSDKRVHGRNFIVTGGTQGIGRAVAEHLAREGAAGITICGRNRGNGEAVVASVTENGCECEFVAADLVAEKDCREVVQRAIERFETVHGLVNAAGITDRGSLDNTTVDLWDRMMNINARAPFILSQEVARFMRANGTPGSIVNIISDQYHGGSPELLPYAASKAALAAMTKNTANALLDHRIRVNGVCIGWTYTPNEHALQVQLGKGEGWITEADASRPFGRLLRPRDVALLVTYLLSDESQMMTGALIDFDQKVIGTS